MTVKDVAKHPKTSFCVLRWISLFSSSSLRWGPPEQSIPEKKELKIPLIASPAIPAVLQEKQSDHQDARRHLLHFLLVDAEGRQHLAATATDAGDAHYTYR